MKKLLVFILWAIFLVPLMFSTTWYVRAAGGTYGNEDGTAYADAWDGLLNVVWGGAGVVAGDTLYVCGNHIYTMAATSSIATRADINFVSGSVGNIITVRGDYGGDPGRIWGAYIPTYEAWTDEGDSVWSITLKASTYGGLIFEDIGTPAYDDYTLLAKVADQATCVSTVGSHYSPDYALNSKLYVHCSDSGSPTGRIAINRYGHELRIPDGASYITFLNLDIFANYRFEFGTDKGINHITWDTCTLWYAETRIITFRDGNDDITIQDSDLGYSITGIYAISDGSDPPDRYTISGNEIHHCGYLSYQQELADPHAIGAQGGDGAIIEDNEIHTCGQGIVYYIYANHIQTNTITRRNYIHDLYAAAGGTQYGISYGCNNTADDDQTGNSCYQNILVGCEVGIYSKYIDEVDFFNNVADDCDTSYQFQRTTLPASNKGPNVEFKNNISIAPANYHLYFTTIAANGDYAINADYNCFYDGGESPEFYFRDDGGVQDNLSFAQWKGLTEAGCVFDPNSIDDDPSLDANYASDDSGDPVVDAGVDVGLITDYIGLALPSNTFFDIGPYELNLGGVDQVDFPNIYIDADAGDGGVGSQAVPYNELSDINWTTGGDNSVFDYLAGTPAAHVRIKLQDDDEWREQLTVGASGNATYRVIIESYGDGADPIINGSDIITTWTAYGAVATSADYAFDEEAAKAFQNWRMMVYAAKLSTSGGQIRITVKAHSSTSYTINSCFIGISDTVGNEYDYSATPTRITFGSSNSVTVTGGGSDEVSDWITFDIDEAVDYVIGINETGGTQPRVSDAAYKHYINNDGTDDSDDMSFSSDTNAERHYYVETIEVRSALGSTWQNAIGATEPLIVWMDDTELTEGSGKDALADHEWVFDSNVLYLRDDTGDPDGSGVEIEAGQRTQGIKIQGKDYITMDGLDCRKTNYWGIYVYDSSNYINTTNCVLNTNRRHGIRHNTVTYCTVTSSTAYSNGLQGFSFNVDCTPGCSASDCTSYSNGEEGFGAEEDSDGVTFTDCVAYQNGKAGFSTSDVRGIVYTRCVSYENGQVVAASGNGFGLFDGESVGSQAYYYYCIAYKNVASGLRINHALTGGSTSKAYNCVFYANEAYNVHIDDDTLDMKNCILMDAGYDKEIKVGAGFTPTLSNNCYYDSDATTTCEFDSSDYTSKATWEAASGETNSVWANPLMVDPANDDFTLNPHSPCIFAGTPVGLLVDFVSMLIRHAPCIGAYENQINAIWD